MSYQWEFVNSRKIGDKWGYNIYISDGAVPICPRGQTGLISPGGVVTINTLTRFGGYTEKDAFIAQSEEGLTVPLNFEELELMSLSTIKAGIESDRVIIYDSGNMSLASASASINRLPFSVATPVPLSSWVIASRRKLLLDTPDIQLTYAGASFIGKLDLNPILPLRGTFTISELISRGAVAKYLTFPTITASTQAVDW